MLLSGERAIVIDELTKPYKVLLFESRNKNNEKIIKMKYGKKTSDSFYCHTKNQDQNKTSTGGGGLTVFLPQNW